MRWYFNGLSYVSTLANVFTRHLEKKISTYEAQGPTYYTPYVDNIFMTFSSDSDFDPFLNFMNNLHKNIKFTKEIEIDQQLPFLDVLVQRSADQYSTGHIC